MTVNNNFMKALRAFFLGSIYILSGIWVIFSLNARSEPVQKSIGAVIVELFFYGIGVILIIRGIYGFYKDIIYRNKHK